MREPDGPFAFELDRSDERSLTEQLQQRLRAAIEGGQLQSGARLPSWRDLAAQLGVARGTVRAAYERLVDERLITASGAAGTHVAGTPPPRVRRARVAAPSDLSFVYSAPPLPFQMGVPAQDAFPAKLWVRVFTASARAEAFAPATYADPRGEPALREQIAAYLAIARGLRCAPEQVFVTNGFRGGLRLAPTSSASRAARRGLRSQAFRDARRAAAAGLAPVAIDVDDEGLDVAEGIARAPDAAVVGSHARAAGSARRRALAAPAAGAPPLGEAPADVWAIEDDYLGEPSSSTGAPRPPSPRPDPAGRVLHLGTFSKTLSPAIGTGFLVAPPALAGARRARRRLLPRPRPPARRSSRSPRSLREGHFLRHLRRMKRLYRARRDALLARLGGGKAAPGLRRPLGSAAGR